MTHELQSTLEATGIESRTLRNHIPCRAHDIQLDLGMFMSCLGVKGCTKSWEAHERDSQFGEDESSDIGKSQRLRKEGNARMNKVSAISVGLAKIIGKVCISRYFESPEIDLHIAENACCIDYTDTWSSKQIHWLLKKLMSALQYYLCIMWRQDVIRQWRCLSEPTHYENSPASGSKIHYSAITGHSSQHRINGHF